MTLLSVILLFCTADLLVAQSSHFEAFDGAPQTSMKFASGDEVAEEICQLAENLQHIGAMLDDLASSRFQTRELAHQRLSKMPFLPDELLKSRLHSEDAEVRLRAESLQKVCRTGTLRLNHLLSMVRQYRLKGVTKSLLVIIEQTRGGSTVYMLQNALMATVVEEEFLELKDALASNEPSLRIAAVLAMGELSHPDAMKHILMLSHDRDDRVCATVAGFLATRQRRECLSILAELLISKEVRIRKKAAIMLQNATGENFGFFKTFGEQQLASVSRQWIEWIDRQPTDFQLRPIRNNLRTSSPFD